MQDKALASARSGTIIDPNQEWVVNTSVEDLPSDRLMQLQKKFRTKRDLYQYLDSRGKSRMRPHNLPSAARDTGIFFLVGVFLPPYSSCSKLFLGQVLTGKRQVLEKRQVPRLTAPKWPELALADIWKQVQADKVLMEYFPKASLLDIRLPSRPFFWGVMFALRPDYCEDLIAEAQDKRAAAGVVKPASQTILNIGITSKWADLLLEKPFTSRTSNDFGNTPLYFETIIRRISPVITDIR